MPRRAPASQWRVSRRAGRLIQCPGGIALFERCGRVLRRAFCGSRDVGLGPLGGMRGELLRFLDGEYTNVACQGLHEIVCLRQVRRSPSSNQLVQFLFTNRTRCDGRQRGSSNSSAPTNTRRMFKLSNSQPPAPSDPPPPSPVPF